MRYFARETMARPKILESSEGRALRAHGRISFVRPVRGPATARAARTESRFQLLDTLRLIGQEVHILLERMQNAATDGEAELAGLAVEGHLRVMANLGLPGKPHAALARHHLAMTQALAASML